MSTTLTPTDWLTPRQFADKLGRHVRWVQNHMRSGHIPYVQIGRYRYITPACIEQMEKTALPPAPADASDGHPWGRVTRKGRRSPTTQAPAKKPA